MKSMNDIQQTILQTRAKSYAQEFGRNRDREEGFADGWQEAMKYVVDYLRLTFDIEVKDEEREARQ
jgi:hypothetical protein